MAETSELAQNANEKLRTMLEKMGVAAEVVVSENDDRVMLEIRGEETGLLIGKHGATLDSIQYLVNKMVSKGAEGRERKAIVVDAENYRGRREEQLVELAHKLADKARKTKKPVAAAPMSAAERRVVHLALANLPGLSTRSEGEGRDRRLMIIPDPNFDFGPEGDGAASA